tara:strand:- start:1145 stop:1540 length:396 start_codon:yes stop_codon:yes gene_type:complete
MYTTFGDMLKSVKARKRVVTIDLMEPEDRHEEETLPAPPVPPPLPEPDENRRLRIVLTDEERLAIRKAARRGKKSPAASSQAKKIAKLILKDQWANIDLAEVSQLMSKSKGNHLCLGGSTMSRILKIALQH